MNKQYVFIADIASWFGIDQKCINHWASKKKKKYLLFYSYFPDSENHKIPLNQGMDGQVEDLDVNCLDEILWL